MPLNCFQPLFAFVAQINFLLIDLFKFYEGTIFAFLLLHCFSLE